MAGAFLLIAAWARPARFANFNLTADWTPWSPIDLQDAMLPLATIALFRCWARLWCFPEKPVVSVWIEGSEQTNDDDIDEVVPAELAALLREHQRRRFPSGAPLHQAEDKQTKQPSKVAERIQQLAERTRICTRQEWEEEHLPQLDGIGKDQKADHCCLCMADIAPDDQVRGLACGHAFHLPCVAEWFMRDPTFELSCPLCRVPLSQQRSFEKSDGQEDVDEFMDCEEQPGTLEGCA